jgi:hypothetical protein
VCPAFEEARARELVKTANDVRVWEEHESPYALVAQILAAAPQAWAKRAPGAAAHDHPVAGRADGAHQGGAADALAVEHPRGR